MPESNLFVGIAGYVGRRDATGKVGVFRRSTEGGEWSHVFGDHETYSVFVHPKDPSIVFAGTSEGVFRSKDHGATFKKTAFPDGGMQIWSFLVADDNPDKMYAGASPINVYRSDDRGESWRKLPNPGIPERCKGPFEPRVMRMAQTPGNSNEIYAALEIAGAMRTTDGGESWEDLSDDLVRLSDLPHLASQIVQKETNAEGMLDGHAITISPGDPGSPIIACRMGLFRTRDGGKSWQDMEVKRFSPTTYGRDVKASLHDPNTLYSALSVAAASHDGGVYKSTDNGETWTRFDKVQVHGTIMSIGLHNSDPNQVYIGARYNGEIFGTTDGGKNWKEMSLPVEVKDIYSLAAG